MKQLLTIAGIFLLFSQAQATTPPDTLQNFMRKGKFEVQARTFFMATINEGALRDFYALGAGIGGGYESPRWKGLQIAVSGYVWDNLASSNLAPQANVLNRYEVGLFDITRPDFTGTLARFEHLRLMYYYKKSSVTLGRMLLKTPFINPQDGRMRPNMQEGIWLDIKGNKKLKGQGGVLWAMSPRSTERWYAIAETFGIYPQGRAVTGRPAQYMGNIVRQPLAVGQLSYAFSPQSEAQFWAYYMPQMFYTQLLQWESRRKSGASNSEWLWGAQWAWQQGLDTRPDLTAEQRYMPENHRAWVLSGRIGKRIGKQTFALNYTHIGDGGQWLFPREWGRDPFYTFIPRERNEGFANVHALTLNYQTTFSSLLQLQLSIGNYSVPSPTNAAKNKYAMPDYQQFNMSLLYRPKGFWKGLEMELLYVLKNNGGSARVNDNFVINKVNMHHVNWIVNYRF
ncbi:OprD family outer membrane porin [Rhodoflexus sp.]